MELLLDNLSQTLAVAGLILLVVEIAVLGFSTFVLFFVGIALLVTAGLMYLQLIPDTLMNAFLTTSILTIVSTLILWRPLKKMQSKAVTPSVTSDLVGHSFVLEQDISTTQSYKYHFSGVDWLVKSKSSIPAGKEVMVEKADVGVFEVVEKP